MNLTEGCWGHVNVYVKEKWGGVRIDTWQEEKSKTLCKNLGCGTSIATTKSPKGRKKVIVESLHTIVPATNLNQSILVLSQNETNSTQPNYDSAYVVCSGNESMCTSSVDFVYFFSFTTGKSNKSVS